MQKDRANLTLFLSIGYGGWRSEGVTTIGNVSTNFTTTVECSSTHLTSFSVLVTLVEINVRYLIYKP